MIPEIGGGRYYCSTTHLPLSTIACTNESNACACACTCTLRKHTQPHHTIHVAGNNILYASEKSWLNALRFDHSTLHTLLITFVFIVL